MRTHATLVAVVLLALTAGVASFLLATPDDAPRPSIDSLGFTQLAPDTVAARLADARAYHLARHRDALARRAAHRVAASWLRGLPEPAVGGAPAVRGADPAARARIRALERWADDLPAAAWEAALRPAEPAGSPMGAPAPGGPPRYVARGWVAVTLARADPRERRQQVAVQVEVVRLGAGKHARWVIDDARATGPATILRAYADPVVVRRGFVDVVAPRARAARAAAVADEAQRALSAVRSRHPVVAGSAVVTVWIVDAAALAGAGGSRPRAGARAWSLPAGDVVFDARATAADEQLELLELRTEVARVATRALPATAPALWRDAVSAYEARRLGSPHDPLEGVDMTPLATAFRRGETRLAALLVARGDDVPTGAAPTEQLAGLATVAWLESTRGHDHLVRVLARLRAGVAPAVVLRDVLQLDPRGVEVAVGRWTRTRLAEEEESTRVTRDEASEPAEEPEP